MAGKIAWYVRVIVGLVHPDAVLRVNRVMGLSGHFVAQGHVFRMSVNRSVFQEEMIVQGMGMSVVQGIIAIPLATLAGLINLNSFFYLSPKCFLREPSRIS